MTMHNVYDGVPPVTLTVAEPVLPPLHKTFVCAGWWLLDLRQLLTVTDVVAVHPFASVTVTV
jgi:hypothetical protein